MKVKFDNRTIKTTKRFENALIELMQAECEMMGKVKGHNKENWQAGKCEINDMAYSCGLIFTYGDKNYIKGKNKFIVKAGIK
jgi:hypothetical protein